MVSNFDRIKRWTALPALLLVFLAMAMGGMFTDYFIKASYLNSIFKNYMPVIFSALGLSVVIIGGGIDLSIGTLASLVNCVIVYLYLGLRFNPYLAVAAGVAIGIGFGALNGVLISIFRLNSLITTFAMSWITGCIALWILPEPSKYSMAADFSRFYKGSLGFIPTPFVMLIIALIVWYCIMSSSTGPQIYAMGSDLKRAFVTGIDVAKTRIVSYMYSGFMASLAGIAILGSMGGGFASVGDSFTLPGIAACVIGGISLSGGSGTAAGGVIGGIFMAFLTSLVLAMDVDPYYQSLLTNAVILLSILIPSLIRTLWRKRA
jgi:ribose transport system permease protein